MKNLSTLITAFLVFAFMSPALAYVVEVGGIVQDQLDRPVPKHLVLIEAYAPDGRQIHKSEVYTNDAGEFADRFDAGDIRTGTVVFSTKSCDDRLVQHKQNFTKDRAVVKTKLTICAGATGRCDVKIEVVRTAAGIGLVAHGSGVAPFTYEWSTGDSTQRISIDSMGEYCVKITDAAGCEAKACFDYTTDRCAVEIVATRTAMGIVLVANAKGTSPIEYNWSTGDSTQRIAIDSLGEYCVTILTADSCEARACIDLSKIDKCEVEIEVERTTSGLVLIAKGKGSAPIQYTWNTGDSTQRILVDSLGEYCVTILTADSCEARACIDLSNNDRCAVEIKLQQTPAGTFLIAQGKGTSPISYEWNTGDSTERIAITRPGTYCVTILTADSCRARACFDYAVRDSCGAEIVVRALTDTVSLWAVGKGTAPFTYEWSTGDTTQVIMPQRPGTYCVKITDATGCMAKACYRVGRTDTVDCSVDIRVIKAGGFAVLIADAHGQPPFKYEWSTGETRRSIRVKASGEYCVKVVDASGCEAKACYQFDADAKCNVAIVVRGISPDRSSRTLSALAKGTAPFTYEWSTGDTTQSITVQNKGQYCVVMTDADGCQARACITLPTDRRRTPTGSRINLDNNDTQLRVYPNPASDKISLILPSEIEMDYQYRIINAQGFPMMDGNGISNNLSEIDIMNLQPGHYTVIVITATEAKTVSFFKQ